MEWAHLFLCAANILNCLMNKKETKTMKTPETSKLFAKKTNEKSGAEYYVLKERVAYYQQGFYFVNNSMTTDGRYLWFYASFPPVYNSNLRKLGVIDFQTDEIYLLNDTLFNEASPYIDPVSGEAYFAWDNRIFKRSPKKDSRTEEIIKIKTEGTVRTIATHLTPSPDKNEFFLTIHDHNINTRIGSVNIKTGEFSEWAKCDHWINHEQFNPQNSDIALCAYDYSVDIITGQNYTIPSDENGNYLRLWTVERNGKMKTYPPHNNFATHEWWSADGKKIYYVNFFGIHRLNLESGEHICVADCNPWHAHATKDEKLFIYDEKIFDKGSKLAYRGMPTRLNFYNSESKKTHRCCIIYAKQRL